MYNANGQHHVALFMYSCASEIANLTVFGPENSLVNTARFKRRSKQNAVFVFSVPQSPAGERNIQLKYSAQSSNCSAKTPSIIGIIPYWTSTRGMLYLTKNMAPIPNNPTLITVNGTVNETNTSQCVMDVHFNLNCVDKGKCCGRRKVIENLRYILQNEIRSCSINANNSRQFLKVRKAKTQVRRAYIRRYRRAYTQTDGNNLVSFVGSFIMSPNRRKKWHMQLLWYENGQNSVYLPFREFDFRLGENCSVTRKVSPRFA